LIQFSLIARRLFWQFSPVDFITQGLLRFIEDEEGLPHGREDWTGEAAEFAVGDAAR
jgi:hypothetical protein